MKNRGTGAGENWKAIAAEVDNAVAGIKDTLNSAKEKIGECRI